MKLRKSRTKRCLRLQGRVRTFLCDHFVDRRGACVLRRAARFGQGMATLGLAIVGVISINGALPWGPLLHELVFAFADDEYRTGGMSYRPFGGTSHDDVSNPR